VCPAGDACDDTHHLCVLPEQLSACTGMADGTDCTAKTVTGHCLDQVCLPSVCGDRIVELGEGCDDGNAVDGTYDADGVLALDGCSADCHSDFSCGNQLVDVLAHEECDDRNNLDHDGCSSTCKVETPRWTHHTMAPAVRSGSTSSYDSKRDRLIMFGGNDTSFHVTNEVYEWTGFDWITLDPVVAPVQRAASAMAYDRDLDRTVMFGGFDGTYEIGDTWLWNGAVWTNVNAPGPIGRTGHVMVYDPRRRVVVLFGGYRTGAEFGVFDDTWEFDGKAWKQITTAHAPAKREYAEAAYDPKAGAIVLTGGDSGFGATVYFADTWTYDGTDWHDVTPGGLSPKVASAAIGYDLGSQRVLMYGGTTTGGVVTSATWAWSGTAWTNLGNSAAVGTRSVAALAGTRTRTILHGGVDGGGVSRNDTFVWNASTSTWTLVPAIPARGRLEGVNDFAGHRVIFYGGINASNVTVADTWELGSTGYQLRAGGPPSKRQYHSMAWDPVHAQIVLFGGASGATISDTPNNETWVWTGGGWTQKFPATSPPARSHAAMAWDGERIVLCGGQNGEYSPTITYGDAWAWDGTTWTPVASPPPPRRGAAAGYDPIRNQLVMFGGYYNGDSFGDTWLEHGGVWTEVQNLGFTPTRESEMSFAWNPARSSLILSGGTIAGNQTYEWSGTTWALVPAVGTPSAVSDGAVYTTLDGAGISVFGGNYGSDHWELRWEGPVVQDSCTAANEDGDALVGCADADCWTVCTPTCLPNTSCTAGGPTCGDGACDPARESCGTCEVDCGACAPVCGDGLCAPSEVCPGDCP